MSSWISRLQGLVPQETIGIHLKYIHLPVPVIVKDRCNGVFPKWSELSLNSVNLENQRNHWGTNKVHFKDPLCYLCFSGTVVACWFITQEEASSNTTFLRK